MLWIMRIALKNEHCRMALLAAGKAAPYVHAKLASVSVQAEVTDVRKLTDAELTRIVAAGLSELDRAADSAETLDPLTDDGRFSNARAESG